MGTLGRTPDLACLPYVDDPRPYRRLAAAVLLRGAIDARRDVLALEWLNGEQACRWAGLLDLPDWPPAPAMLGSRAELARRCVD